MSEESHRTQKVEKELREIIASYVLRHFTSSMLGISQVRVNKDLRGAKVYLTAFGDKEVNDDKLAEVQAHARDIQDEISKKLRMRYCPRLKFVKDEGAEASRRIDDILNKIKS